MTQIAKSPDKRHVAVGYSDGMVKVFDLHGGEVMVNFSGHKSAVTALSYDHQGLRLVSGAKVIYHETPISRIVLLRRMSSILYLHRYCFFSYFLSRSRLSFLYKWGLEWFH